MDFFNILKKSTETHRERLYNSKLIQAAQRGEITAEMYVKYLEQAYHHVKYTLTLLMTCGSKIAYEKRWIRQSLVHYIDEEIGHEEWILKDIQNCGGNIEEIKNKKPLIETQLIVSAAFDVINRENPISFLGMVFMLENTSIEIATTLANKLQQTLNLDKNCFSYLLSHGTIDQSHMKYLESLLNKVTDVKDQKDIIDFAQKIYTVFLYMLDAVYDSCHEECEEF